jgi:hypothetical protein
LVDSPPVIEMTKEEIGALHREANRLDRLLTVSSRFDLTQPPLADSPMDRATKADLREAYDMAYGLIYAAEDHLTTILLILKVGPLPGFSLYTLLRPAIEAEVRCRHLLDPNIDERLRLSRGLTERLQNLEEQHKADQGNGAVAEDFFKERVAHLEERAKANGITVIRTRKPPHAVRAFEEERTPLYDMFVTHFPGGGGGTVFRFLSGFIHIKPWVWITRDRAQPSSEPGMALVRTDLNVTLFAGVLKTTLDLHDENIKNFLNLSGFTPDIWALAKQRP